MAQNVTVAGASYSDVPSVVLPKTGGGSATFTDVSDTTAAAADVASGKYFYTAAGVKTAGTATGGGGGSLVITDVSNTTGTTAEISVSGSGGGSAQTDTGTFTGGGGNTATISCSFDPDLVYVHGDLTSDPSLRGIVTLTIIKDTYILVTCDSSTSGTGENLMYGAYGITGYSTDTSNPYATYADGVLTINTVTNSGSARWASGITYSYKLVKWS